MVRIKEEERLFAYTIQSSDGGEICSVGIYENTSSRAFMPFFSNQGWFDKESARITVVGTVCKMAEAARREWFGRVLSPPNVAKIGELLHHPSTPTDNSLFQDSSLFQESIRAKLDACLLDHSFGDISLSVDGVRARKKAETQAVTTENADDEPASSRRPPKKRKRGGVASSSAPPFLNRAAPEGKEEKGEGEEEKTKKVRFTPAGHPPVGARVRIYWPSEDDWFEACVLRVAFQDGDWIFRVHYDDDHREEWRSASADFWELVPPSSSLAPPPARAKVHARSPLSAPLPPEQPIPASGGASQCPPSAFCMMNGSGCPTFPAWARFCPSCGSKQF
jgi:hypothetical protein